MYLARHLKLETYRAIKCISKTRSMPSSILSEANILAKLRHPGIPIVYDIEEDEAFYYIIEEYVEGESLEKLLWNTSVSQEYMIQIGIQLCGIVSFLHSHNAHCRNYCKCLFHRDYLRYFSRNLLHNRIIFLNNVYCQFICFLLQLSHMITTLTPCLHLKKQHRTVC